MIAALRPQAGTRRIVFSEKNDDLLVNGEAFLLQQAIRNLIQNALDFTPEGGEIRISTISKGIALQVNIYNDGEAIPDYALDRLFERFYSLPRPNTGQKSTGLGLALTRTILELHGGTVRIGNVAGGVEAVIELPLNNIK